MHEAVSQGCSRRGSGVGVSCVETMLQPSACLSVTSHHLPYPGICNRTPELTRWKRWEGAGKVGTSAKHDFSLFWFLFPAQISVLALPLTWVMAGHLSTPQLGLLSPEVLPALYAQGCS